MNKRKRKIKGKEAEEKEEKFNFSTIKVTIFWDVKQCCLV
jgi:hypothetical protein